MPERIPWRETTAPDRASPRECIRAARDALNKAYSLDSIKHGGQAFTFIAEAVDWQRRALEQMAVGE